MSPGKPWKKKVGDRIANARIRAKLSYEELASKCNVSAMTVRRWEEGTHSPKAGELEAISKATGGTSVDWILFGVNHAGEKQPNNEPVYRGQWRNAPELSADLQRAILSQLPANSWAARCVEAGEIDGGAVVAHVSQSIESWYGSRTRLLPLVELVYRLIIDPRTFEIAAQSDALGVLLEIAESSSPDFPEAAPFLKVSDRRDPLTAEYRRLHEVFTDADRAIDVAIAAVEERNGLAEEFGRIAREFVAAKAAGDHATASSLAHKALAVSRQIRKHEQFMSPEVVQVLDELERVVPDLPQAE